MSVSSTEAASADLDFSCLLSPMPSYELTLFKMIAAFLLLLPRTVLEPPEGITFGILMLSYSLISSSSPVKLFSLSSCLR